MVEILRVQTRWNGFTGAPGYSVMHFRDFTTGGAPSGVVTVQEASAAITRVRTFFSAIAGLIPGAANVLVDAEVQVVESTTGVLVNSLTTAPTGAIPGTANANFSSAVGAVVNWRTNSFRRGRRLRGRTFLVPLSSAAFNGAGAINSTALQTLQTAATALADSTSSPDLLVWGRPTSLGATDGVIAVVSNASVPSMGAILTSRRD